ncbi:MAG: hypothetical protein OXL68_10590 [Paracoccaceae bacterium]|nr:hypothetical protein [Paracoccaceae bacterium]
MRKPVPDSTGICMGWHATGVVDWSHAERTDPILEDFTGKGNCPPNRCMAGCRLKLRRRFPEHWMK